MAPESLLAFLRECRFAVQASVAADHPQAAVVGVTVTDRFEVLFDALASSRKLANLRTNPNIAFVFGGWIPGDERTAQFEGVADEPSGRELDRLKEVYFAEHPGGPERMAKPGWAFVRVRPIWIRYSDFNQSPPLILEFERPFGPP